MQFVTKTQAAPIKKVSSSTRMTLSNVIRGKQEKPLRVIVYGVEGVGKSTFAAQAPSPIFLCSEDGTAQLDIERFPTPRSWADVLEALRVLTYEDHDYKTLVIDTLDWLEPLCWAQVCAASGKHSIEDFGYGKGYVMAIELWRQFLSRLEVLERTRKVNIIMVAHATVRRVDDPYVGPFDRYRMKLHEKSSDLLREWVDAVLFARHEVVATEKKGRPRGVSSGARLIHTQWTAAFDAKNRFDLPEILPLAWDEFERAARAHAPASADKLRRELMELIPSLPDRERAETVLREWAGNNPARLAQLLDKVRAKVALIEGGVLHENDVATPTHEDNETETNDLILEATG